MVGGLWAFDAVLPTGILYRSAPRYASAVGGDRCHREIVHQNYGKPLCRVLEGEEHLILDDPRKFFKDLGGLHDARIEHLRWDPNHRQVTILVDDINSNFLDLPEYKGLAPATLTLSKVIGFILNVDRPDATLNIYELEVCPESAHLAAQFKIRPSGKIKIACASIGIEYHKE